MAPKEEKLTKPKAQIRVMKADLKDLIRDEIYGAASALVCPPNGKVLVIPHEAVKRIAKRIANRAVIGH